MIEVINFQKHFGSQLLFEQLSFQLHEQEWVALTGDSGSGKSTLLRILLGLVDADQGSMTWKDTTIIKDGQGNPEGMREWRKNVAWTPQTIPFGNQTPRQVLRDLRQFEHNQLEDPAAHIDEDWVKALGLSVDQLEQPFLKLSGGEYQRMLLGMSFILDRDWWLLDEPTSALDKANRQRVIDLLDQKKETGMLICTHDDMLISLCNRVLELKDGQLKEV
jgi:ABC-type multidrug transport system ATPase subunit